jgi:hypothetical protein
MKLWPATALFLASVGAFGQEAEEIVHPTLDQIETLVYRERFAEALRPLEQVAPTERSAKWETLVEKAALGHVRTLMREAPAGADGVADQLTKDFPHLQKSQELATLTAEVARMNAEVCLENAASGFECVERAYERVKGTGRPPDYYLSFAALVDRRVCAGAAVPFLELAELAVAPGKTAVSKGCRSSVAQKILGRAFALPAGEPKERALKLAEGPCRATATALLAKRRPSTPHLQDTFCRLKKTACRNVGSLKR